ncbi:hypothetical protein BX666DRAFT_1951495 [Dichotomocladium elegans]|nr:hypothetical protein BX666DRAFT_1951495 [Dichotomocladium elegans]
MAKFEPCSSMFVTTGHLDRLVTLWYTNDKDKSFSQYEFIFLPHPRHVTHFVWRRMQHKSRYMRSE